MTTAHTPRFQAGDTVTNRTETHTYIVVDNTVQRTRRRPKNTRRRNHPHTSNGDASITLQHQDGMRLLVEIVTEDGHASIYMDADQLRRLLDAVTPPGSTR